MIKENEGDPMARKRTYEILLSEDDKKTLNATIHNKKTCKMTIRRCQILLELDQNAPQHLTQMQIAKTFGVSKSTVSNIVAAYVKGGIPAIIKINRNPRRKLDGRMEAELLRIACGPAPDGRARWTLRLLEKQVRLELDEPIGRESIRLALKKMNFDLT